MAAIFTQGSPKRTVPEGRPLVSHIIAGLGSSNPLRRNKLFGGSAGHCARHSFLVQKVGPDVIDTFTPSSTMYMSIGTAVHETICDALFKQGVLMFKEYKLLPPRWLNLGGRVDAIVDIRGDGAPSLVEIKTCGRELPAGPSPEHSQQAQVYSLVTGIDEAYVLYVSREVGYPEPKMVAHRVDTSEAALTYVARQLILATIGVNANLLPPIPASLLMKDCKYCLFRSYCWDAVPLDLAEEPEGPLDESEWQTEYDELLTDLIGGRPTRLEQVMTHLERNKRAK